MCRDVTRQEEMTEPKWPSKRYVGDHDSWTVWGCCLTSSVEDSWAWTDLSACVHLHLGQLSYLQLTGTTALMPHLKLSSLRLD